MGTTYDAGTLPRPSGLFQLHATRRHVDLLRVSSALCPGAFAGCR